MVRATNARQAIAWIALFLLGACAAASPDGAPRQSAEGAPIDVSPAGDPYPDLEGPPPVTVRFGDEAIELAAYSYCFGSVCATGFPPEPLPDIGSPADILVEFPLPGWSFTATFMTAGDECSRQQRVPLTTNGQGSFLLQPAGRAGAYDVTLFGDIKNGGSLAVTFRWTTPTNGPLPEPEARLAVLADHDGSVDSYGIELEVSNLARTPHDASATITVRSDTGEAITFEATPSNGRCLPEGTVYWDGPDNKGLAAAALSGEIFTYEVELVIDGARYVGTGTWPTDVITGNEPSVALHFESTLPGLS
jgi:hypothetical protein